MNSFRALLLGLALPLGAQELSLHGQATWNLQGYGPFDAPYAGANSLEDRREVRGSFTATAFLGWSVWKGGELYVNPELAAGSGVSRVLGLASPPNGETYRVDSTKPKAALARLFLRQTVDLGGTSEVVEEDANQLAGPRSSRRLTFTLGRFSGSDVFDGNTYAHDPRTQFNSWSLWELAAWDYPADTRGYTWGIAAELAWDAWTFRAGSFLEPKEANGPLFDHQVSRAHGEVVELEHDHELAGRKGALRLLAFENHARMGSYREALAQNPAAPDVTATRTPGRRKDGWGLNAEQDLGGGVGGFLRASWNDGRTESWAFTEIDRSLSAGALAKGGAWNRAHDEAGLAFAVNGAAPDHRAYLAAGGYGFMLGDGRLDYAQERLLSAHYLVGFGAHAALTFEAQRYWNPAFNADRGPVNVWGLRLHVSY